MTLCNTDSLTVSLINRFENDFKQNNLPHNPKHRWEMIPDVNGNLYLTDMFAYESNEPLFNAGKDMKFYLSTRQRHREEIKMDFESLNASSFDSNHATRITIHGWNGDETSLVNAKVIEEYLKLGDFNCIMVDWSRGAGRSGLVKPFAAISFFISTRYA